MKNDKTEQIIQDMLDQMNQDIELEESLKIHAQDIARALIITGSVRTTIKGMDVILKYMKQNNTINVYIFDVEKLNIAGSRYRPAIFSAKEDSQFSFKENLEKIILTALYYEHDIIKPEEILEEE